MQNRPTTPQPTTNAEGFPSFWYGPDDASAVFNSASEVPSGWADHPSKVGLPTDKAPKKPRKAAEPEPSLFEDATPDEGEF